MRGLVGVRRRPTEEAGEQIAVEEKAGDSADPVDVAEAPTDPFRRKEPGASG
jgi:hypothetical protein